MSSSSTSVMIYKIRSSSEPPSCRGSSSMKRPVIVSMGRSNEDVPISTENNKPNQLILTPWTMLQENMKRERVTEKEKIQILSDYWKQIRQPASLDQLCGGIVQEGLFQQNLLVKSFEIGNDGKMSIVALANHLQEAKINHSKSMRLYEDGFASTAEMTKRDLIWVLPKIHIYVHRYPFLGDRVKVSNWMYESGRTALRSDSIVTDIKTGEVLVLASRSVVMINKKTRRLTKLTEEVKERIRPHLMPNCSPLVEGDISYSKTEVDMTEQYTCLIKIGWNDLDINQHVNNTKYIDWLLESLPPTILRTHELSSITLEYRKECSGDAVLQSITREAKRKYDHCPTDDDGIIEFRHSLCLEGGGPEVVRGGTLWKPRQKYCNF